MIFNEILNFILCTKNRQFNSKINHKDIKLINIHHLKVIFDQKCIHFNPFIDY